MRDRLKAREVSGRNKVNGKRSSRRGPIGALAGGLFTALIALGLFVGSGAPSAGAASHEGACSNSEYRQGAGANLPDCRAYEQVSPVEKNGFDVQAFAAFSTGPSGADPLEAGGPIAADGSAAAFISPGAFADTTFGGAGKLLYVSGRDGDGWATRAVIPRVSPAFRGYTAVAFTPDLGASLLNINAPLLGVAGEDEDNLYVRGPLGQLSFVAGADAGIGSVGAPARASADLSRIAFYTSSVLTDDPGQPTGITAFKVYKAENGSLSLVSREGADGAPFPSAFLGEGTGLRDSLEHVVSDDGEHIFFTAPRVGDARKIYRRTAGVTELVSPDSDPADPAGESAKVFKIATPSGDRVFFTTTERLTPDANDAGGEGDLYRYDIGSEELVNVSAATAGTTASNVRGVVGIGDAGDRVYHVARGVIDADPSPNGAVPTASEPNLYVWEDDGTPEGSTRFIATLNSDSAGGREPDDEDNWLWGAAHRAEVSADGRHAVFQSSADIGGYDADGTAQIYRYSAAGDGSLTCVSCPDGTPTGDAVVPTSDNGFSQDRPRFLSDDGSRVFFTSPEGLLPRDTNGKLDAYMWQDGELHLLSTGTSGDDSYFHSSDATGDNAFFRTRERLVGQDVDTLSDLYVARVGGGLSAQQAAPREDCEGDACQGAPARSPEPRVPSSEFLAGSGNVVSLDRRARVQLAKLTGRDRARLARGRPVVVRVRTGGPGPVRVIGRARVGRRVRMVAQGRGRAGSSAGVARVRLRLSRPARRQLRRAGALRMRLQVRSPGARPGAVIVRLGSRGGRR